MKLILTLTLLGCVLLSDGAVAAETTQRSAKPNIIVMLVDDMGFSDLGCYGSEIPTPNIDRLAAGGVKFTQFYNTARCCPTRAALLTGLYSHQAGVGWMTQDFGPNYPGYRGLLRTDRITIAEALKPAGYFTAMVGKWHLGQGTKPPAVRFDRSLQSMAGGIYYPATNGMSGHPRLVLNGKNMRGNPSELPKTWYSTDLWTEFGLKFIDEAQAEKKPFFLYLAHNAPHFPLQADPEDIARFRGKYKAGWDALSAARHKKQVELGLIDPAWGKADRPEAVKAWDSLSDTEKDRFDHLMAIYAACVWRIDRSVGTLVEGLKKRGLFDNTLIMIMSDNGGNAEGGVQGTSRGPGELGSANSTVFSGESWAWMQNTPFRMFKHYTREGGIATPLIVHWPAEIKGRGEWRREPGHLIDIMATCLDAAGTKYPAELNGAPHPTLVRADSGFCDEQWLQLLEHKKLPYIVVGRLYQPTKSLIRGCTEWEPTELAGTEVADITTQAWGWTTPRRVILIRHREQERPKAGGKQLLNCPGYRFQMLITSLPSSVSGLEVWRRYNGRAGCENIIKELDASFALPQICLKKFYATESALTLAIMSYNLCVLFQRHVGWQERVTAATLRFRLFTTGGVISRTAGVLTVKLAVKSGPLRSWWERLMEKITIPFPNCIAVAETPPNYAANA